VFAPEHQTDMDRVLPAALQDLLTARAPDVREAAWNGLIAEHSPLLLRVARSIGGGEDATMDRYTFILEKLRQENFRRLQAYSPKSNAKFTTWLVVVARRLCLDHYRERYGRPRGSERAGNGASGQRRQLEDLNGSTIDLAEVADPSAAHPLLTLQAGEEGTALQQAIEGLSAEDRLLLKLRFDDDLPAREIARLVHLPTAFHVYRRVNALCAALRHQLRAQGVDRSER
jgi:RNA polymerase sigma factor (sigma-70 family)